MENGPPKWLPDGWTLFRGFGGLSLANWGEIGRKLKRPISLFDQTRRRRVLTNWCWYVIETSCTLAFSVPFTFFNIAATTVPHWSKKLAPSPLLLVRFNKVLASNTPFWPARSRLIACSSTKTKTKTKVFVRSCMFWNKPLMNEPIKYVLCYVILRAWFVRHRHYLERTKTFVFGFVFVFAHKQVISLLNFFLLDPGLIT